MKLKNLVCLVIVSLIISACDVTQLDVLEPALPEYSQSGLNTGGCIINDQVWRDLDINTLFFGVERTLSIRYDTVSGRSRIILPGNMRTPNNVDVNLAVYFQFENLTLKAPLDLMTFSETSFEIDGINVTAGISPDKYNLNPCIADQNIIGNIYFRYLSLTELSSNTSGVVMAGTYGFRIESQCGEMDALNGRFDYVFDRFNFEADSL